MLSWSERVLANRASCFSLQVVNGQALQDLISAIKQPALAYQPLAYIQPSRIVGATLRLIMSCDWMPWQGDRPDQLDWVLIPACIRPLVLACIQHIMLC